MRPTPRGTTPLAHQNTRRSTKAVPVRPAGARPLDADGQPLLFHRGAYRDLIAES